MAILTEEIEVVGPAGGRFIVLTRDEERYFKDLCRRYTEDYAFQNISDLGDLERVIQGEVMSQRYNIYLSLGTDYWDTEIKVKEYEDALAKKSTELRGLKKALGIDRTSRQKDSSESLSDYIEKLKQRAKEFGVARDKMGEKSRTLFAELEALVTLHDNCTEDERRTQGVRPEDILEWLRSVAFPEYKAIDQHFVEKQQRFWVQEN